MEQSNAYKRGFIPYALAAFLIGIVGGFSTVLGPAFVQDIGIAYSNTTWTALAAPFGVAVFVPMFTNQITNGIAAVGSFRSFSYGY